MRGYKAWLTRLLGIITYVIGYFNLQYRAIAKLHRLQYYEAMDQKNLMAQPYVLLEVKTGRTGEETPEAMVQFLASLTGIRKRILLTWRRGIPMSLEIAVIRQTIHFYLFVPEEHRAFIESQLISSYPKALISRSKDYLPELFKHSSKVSLGQLKLASGFAYPIRTYKSFTDVDPLASLLSVLSKAEPEDIASVQLLLLPVGSSWQSQAAKLAMSKSTDASGATISNPHASVINEKIASNGLKTAIRIAVSGQDSVRSKQYLQAIANSFAVFNNPSGNSFFLRRPYLWQKNRMMNVMLKRSRRFMPTNQILNLQELATVYHFPTAKLATTHNISWHKTILSDPPEALPVAEGITDEEKESINFIARTEFKNKLTTFGVKKVDRRKHVYIIGKTGSGKSTLVANMAINDMRNRQGFCIVDPHGDLCEKILDFVPSYRINDIVYLDPANTTHAFGLNPLEVENPAQKELVISGIVSIFNKLYGHSWGPRLEYILRNTLLSVSYMPDPTLLMVPEMLTNPTFREKVIAKIDDPVLVSFWVNEFANMTDKLRTEAISPIQNKVGQFVSSTVIRNIIAHPKSTINLEEIMNDGKILLLNLSQGRLGEDNAALLGAMIITKLQLAAMNRVTIKEEERRDFYLYVDEFQNFATGSFIKILSEARKYRLNLILANQYIAQIPEEVRHAIFGNAGTMLSFLIGADDSRYMAREFGERFKEEDLLALGNYQAIIKLAIDGITQAPFLCSTLPLPRSETQNREKVIQNSIQRYMKPVHK